MLAKQQPTTVAVKAFRASVSRGGVTLSWRTSSEVETLGFHVYRQRHGKLIKLKRTLIPTVFGGTTTGHAYSWLDRSAPKGAAKYRLQSVGLSGKRGWVGSASVAG